MKRRVLILAALLLWPYGAVEAADWRMAAGKAVLQYARKHGRELAFHFSVTTAVELLKEFMWSPKEQEKSQGTTLQATIPDETKRFLELYEKMLADKDFLSSLDRNLVTNLHRWNWCRAIDPDLRIRGCTELIQYTDSDSDMASAFNNRGFAYYEKREYDRAIRDYSQALQLNSRLWQAYNNRGISLAETRQFERALQDFDHAIRIKPDYALAFYNRGHVYDDLSQFDRAIKEYDTAIRFDPSYVDAFVNRGAAYSDNGQHQVAMRDFNRAIELSPGYALAYMNRGRVYDRIGDYQRAAEDFARGIQLDSKLACALLGQWGATKGSYTHLRGCPPK